MSKEKNMADDDQGPVKKEGVKEATGKMTNDGDGMKSTLQPLGEKRARPGNCDVKSEATNTSPKPAKRVHAEEVIDIEDDKQQQEMSEEPTVPWICDIYRRDIVQFLSREEIEEMRVALPSWMLPVMATPKMLPRRVYDFLEVIHATGNDYRVNEQGYIWFGRNEYEWGDWNDVGSDWRFKLEGDPFHEVLQFSRCCKDEKAKTAEALAGQLLYPKLDEKTPVGLRLGLLPRMPVQPILERTVVWRAANKLTRDTAAGLLHFLHHLDGCCMRRLLVQTNPLLNNDGDATDGGEQEGALNPRMFQVYREIYGNGKALRLYAKQVAEWDDGTRLDHWRHGGGVAGANPNLLRTTDLATMRTARQLCGGNKAIRPFPCVSVHFNNGQAVLDLISSLRPYCNKLMLFTTDRTPADILDAINHIVNYFKHDFGGGLATLIPQVKFATYGGGGDGGALYGVPLRNGLPASCPKGEATTQTHEQARARHRRGGRTGGGLTQFTYKFRFETAASGEHFHVKIRTVRLRQRAVQRVAGADEEMYGMELRFDNIDDTSALDEGLMDVDFDY